MIDDRCPPTNDPTNGDMTLENQRRLLELELIKVRNEASAARLDARAAEVESMIRRLREQRRKPGSTIEGIPINTPHINSMPRIASWDELRRIQARQIASFAAGVSKAAVSSELQSTELTTDVRRTPKSEGSIVRNDGPETSVRRPNFFNLAEDSPEKIAFVGTELGQTLSIDPDGESDEGTRGRSAAWLFSGLVHVLILLMLAGVGIQLHRPKDQIAMTGSATEVSQASMETFELESSEPVDEPTESEPSEVEYEISPVGEVAVAEFKPASTTTPPTPAAASMASTATAANIQSLKSDSDSRIEFCGVEGGGNHFVYLVDCSKSMGDAFPSARRALLASIDALTAKQRFYVIFYDRKPDYMRISSPQQDEQRSVYATDQNKAALHRWAQQISMDNGWAPYDPMQFALNLKPDVIFLLSDGEFPQKFEEMVKQENKNSNLFGDSDLISIIHTISYYSKEGESRMQRIAQQNQGQYRHVPKP